MPPRLYRDWSRNLTPSSLDAALQPQEQEPPASQAYSIYETKIRRLRRVHLAFLRHTGPYEAVPESLFDILGDWADSRGLLADSDARPPIWMGIGHDAPHTTHPENLRFDAALVVPAAFRAQSGSPIGYQTFEGGDFAVTTHAGPYSTLPAAYAVLFRRLARLPKQSVTWLPAVEIYQTSRVRAGLRLNVTDICLPVTTGAAAALEETTQGVLARRSHRKQYKTPL